MGVFHSGTVNQPILNKNEKKVLHGICKYPTITDSELSTILQMKLSTLTSIKRRLTTQGYYRPVIFPLPSRLGCELLAIIYMQFNPVIPLKERMETTKRTIEVFDEIFFSVGEEEKGFSISLSQNYTNIGRINEIRTETFGKLGLLEKEYHSALVKYPTVTTQQIGDLVNLSRHTVARMKKKFFEDGLLQTLILPNLKTLGIEILTIYHISFNPNKAPNMHDLSLLNSPSTIFFASKKFEAVLLSAYPTYQDYKEDEMNKIRFLKENNLFSHPPFISTYMLERMEVIKEFDFPPLVNKILGGIS